MVGVLRIAPVLHSVIRLVVGTKNGSSQSSPFTWPRPSTWPTSWASGLLQGLVAGAYFPVSELPRPLRAVAQLLPQTYAIDAVRRPLNVTTGTPLLTLGSLSVVQSDILILTASAIILLAPGISAFSLGMAKAQRDGGLSRWV